MPLIHWNNSLSVNIKQIDSQHESLIRTINELHDAMSSGKGIEVVGKIIAQLQEYAKTHFRTEENYFTLFKYPEAEAHKAEHKFFLGKVEQFRKDYQAKTIGLSLSVMDFLSDWFRKHVRETDKKYSTFFLQNGLS